MTFDVTESIVLAASHGKAVRLSAGQHLRVTNPYGTQAVDFWAFADGDMTEYLSMDNFRSFNSMVFATMETALVSNHRRPLVKMVEDTSAGKHDTLLCACNADIYRQLGVKGYHRSCADNLHEALGELSLSLPFTPAPVNLFMSVHVHGDGTIERLLPTSKPGAHIVLKAEIDAVLAFSCCPQDVTTINGPDRTPRDCLIEILAPAAGAA
jgi:uncharacterized protein YcgI (DUF1989 family)